MKKIASGNRRRIKKKNRKTKKKKKVKVIKVNNKYQGKIDIVSLSVLIRLSDSIKTVIIVYISH